LRTDVLQGRRFGTTCPRFRAILTVVSARLSTPAATALYVGAVLGPGVLLVPSLVAETAGPASVLVWAALLALSGPLAWTFAALGVRFPEAGGTAAYARAAFGARAGAVTGWWFLAAVVIGAPGVAYMGGAYVAELAGAGHGAAVAAAGAMMAIVVLANARGLAATARMQLALTGVLAALLAVAVATALPESRAANWAPFAPHGWAALGSAASLLMFSFIGWEAVSHLVGDLRDPARQLPRAILGALAVVVVLYLGLAVATVGVLGTASPSSVPLADLMAAGLGSPGRTGTILLAVLLCLGTMSAYVAAAVRLAGALSAGRPPRALGVFAATSAALLALLAAGVLGADDLVHASSACFVAVYASATAAGVRLLAGGARRAAAVSAAAILVVLGFAGWYLAVPAAVAAAVLAVRPRPALRPARAC
jgi:amino acid efflux transporter